MNSTTLKWLFIKLNGKVLSVPDRPGQEVWVLKKPARPSLLAKSKAVAENLTGSRHLIKAYRLAASIMMIRRKPFREQTAATPHAGFLRRSPGRRRQMLAMS
ncbi:MAG: hypothetical protein ACKVQA_22020 [Burkholderiales bacterium]